LQAKPLTVRAYGRTGLCVPSDGFEPPASTFGTSRSAPLSYEGLSTCRGTCERRDSNPLSDATGLQPAPTLPRWRARLDFSFRVPDRIRTGASRVTVERSATELQPPWFLRAYPRRDLNPQPSVCRTVALPLSYTGMCGTYPGLELNQRPPSYQDGALPLSYQDLVYAGRDSNPRPTA
jgi:hypothetical protein